MGKKNLFAALAVAGLILVAAPAAANFHIMRIVQVYAGDATHPDAQYVVLQMCIAGQNVLGGHSVGFFDAAGAASRAFSSRQAAPRRSSASPPTCGCRRAFCRWVASSASNLG